MHGQMIELYSDADLTRLQRQIKRWRIVLWILAVTALAVCITLAALTGTKNAERMELATIAVSTLAGWFVIYGHIFIVSAAKRELSHAMMLRTEERQTVRGAVTVTNERIVIRNSITARRVEVLEDGQLRRLMVCESRAAALAKANAVTLHTAHSYVAAYEVTP